MFGLDFPSIKNPIAALRKMSPDAKAATHIALDVMEHGAVFPLRDVPGVFMHCMRESAELHGVPAMLLAAIAAALTNFDVGYTLGERRGLMGLQNGQPGAVTADEDMLCESDQDADGNRIATSDAREQATLVRANIDGAARELARLREKFPAQGWAGVIEKYAGDKSAAVVGTFLLYTIRGADMTDAPLQLIRDALED